MKRNRDKPTDAADLRRRAEDRLRSRQSVGGDLPSEVEMARLVHELQVHQIELGMQNEELMQSRAQLESLLDQYTGLYDFAPIGYLTFDREGTIRRVNLTGARLLGFGRSLLINRSFDLLIGESDRRGFSDLLQRVFASRKLETCELSLLREGAQPLHVRIEAVSSEDGEECRAAVFDVTERVQSGAQLREAKEWLQLAINSGKVGLWDWDLRAEKVTYSPEWKHQIGYDDHEIADTFDEW